MRFGFIGGGLREEPGEPRGTGRELILVRGVLSRNLILLRRRKSVTKENSEQKQEGRGKKTAFVQIGG